MLAHPPGQCHFCRVDQEVLWWTTVVFGHTGETEGPRYRRIAADIERAVDTRTVAPGRRLPAERTLAAALCVSRGTVVRAFEELVERGVVERIHGSGTFVRPRPTLASCGASAVETGEPEVSDSIDVSRPVPADASHLPRIDWHVDPTEYGSGVHRHGLTRLRSALAHHLTCYLNLPTRPDQVIVTTGVAASLDSLLRVFSAGRRPVVVGAPMWPELCAVVTERSTARVGVPADAAGIDPMVLRRILRRTTAPVVVLDATESGPSGRRTAASRLPRLAAAVEDRAVVAVEDLSALALEAASDPNREPTAAVSNRVTAIGDLGRLFWAGLGIGWIRAADPVQPLLIALAESGRPGVTAQIQAARILESLDAQWFVARRDHLARRVSHLREYIAQVLPSWTVEPSTSGDGVWVRLPVVDSSTFVHVAARLGVRVCAGRECSIDGSFREYLWMSAAAETDVLELAVDRLGAAWSAYTLRLAASV